MRKSNLESFYPKLVPEGGITEDLLISLLTAKNRIQAWVAIRDLQNYGTEKAICPLKEVCLRPIADLQVTGIFTLQALAGDEIADFAVEMLQDKRFKQNWAALAVACETCGPEHRKVLEARVKAATSRVRACPKFGTLQRGQSTEVLHFLRYLNRIGQSLGPVHKVLLGRTDRLTNEEVTALEATGTGIPFSWETGRLLGQTSASQSSAQA